ncbi:hypothetical protein Strain138_001063 [Pseudogemmatithrix spongiicola]|uniref:Uncharacterized protein n=1 Tax=Pseudogemmatithrix spongiicola TaxID=3062599 RepID=A0AA49JTM0_9BACT|nr:hypothetical protein Strain138_001063 [Gemmatimonadaceae bacterium 'strain 138']WKW14707.1 hypothetical protein Strain318_001063 [Gemmatimonadaceae bacterium 'strain 318']
MLTTLLQELGRVPWWTLLLVLNLIAGLLAAFTQVPAMNHRRAVVRWSGYALGMIVCAMVGMFVLLAYGVMVQLESMAFRATVGAPRRRIH